ncbi:hypothetical protein QOT17_018055 [Balamuthia mandrillaris]
MPRSRSSGRSASRKRSRAAQDPATEDEERSAETAEGTNDQAEVVAEKEAAEALHRVREQALQAQEGGSSSSELEQPPAKREKTSSSSSSTSTVTPRDSNLNMGEVKALIAQLKQFLRSLQGKVEAQRLNPLQLYIDEMKALVTAIEGKHINICVAGPPGVRKSAFLNHILLSERGGGEGRMEEEEEEEEEEGPIGQHALPLPSGANWSHVTELPLIVQYGEEWGVWPVNYDGVSSPTPQQPSWPFRSHNKSQTTARTPQQTHSRRHKGKEKEKEKEKETEVQGEEHEDAQTEEEEEPIDQMDREPRVNLLQACLNVTAGSEPKAIHAFLSRWKELVPEEQHPHIKSFLITGPFDIPSGFRFIDLPGFGIGKKDSLVRETVKELLSNSDAVFLVTPRMPEETTIASLLELEAFSSEKKPKILVSCIHAVKPATVQVRGMLLSRLDECAENYTEITGLGLDNIVNRERFFSELRQNCRVFSIYAKWGRNELEKLLKDIREMSNHPQYTQLTRATKAFFYCCKTGVKTTSQGSSKEVLEKTWKNVMTTHKKKYSISPLSLEPKALFESVKYHLSWHFPLDEEDDVAALVHMLLGILEECWRELFTEAFKNCKQLLRMFSNTYDTETTAATKASSATKRASKKRSRVQQIPPMAMDGERTDEEEELEPTFQLLCSEMEHLWQDRGYHDYQRRIPTAIKERYREGILHLVLELKEHLKEQQGLLSQQDSESEGWEYERDEWLEITTQWMLEYGSRTAAAKPFSIERHALSTQDFQGQSKTGSETEEETRDEKAVGLGVIAEDIKQSASNAMNNILKECHKFFQSLEVCKLQDAFCTAKVDKMWKHWKSLLQRWWQEANPEIPRIPVLTAQHRLPHLPTKEQIQKSLEASKPLQATRQQHYVDHAATAEIEERLAIQCNGKQHFMLTKFQATKPQMTFYLSRKTHEMIKAFPVKDKSHGKILYPIFMVSWVEHEAENSFQFTCESLDYAADVQSLLFIIIEPTQAEHFVRNWRDCRVPTVLVALPRDNLHPAVGLDVAKLIAEYYEFPMWWRISHNVRGMNEFHSSLLRMRQCSLARGMLFGESFLHRIEQIALEEARECMANESTMVKLTPFLFTHFSDAATKLYPLVEKLRSGRATLHELSQLVEPLYSKLDDGTVSQEDDFLPDLIEKLRKIVQSSVYLLLYSDGKSMHSNVSKDYPYLFRVLSSSGQGGGKEGTNRGYMNIITLNNTWTQKGIYFRKAGNAGLQEREPVKKNKSRRPVSERNFLDELTAAENSFARKHTKYKALKAIRLHYFGFCVNEYHV